MEQLGIAGDGEAVRAQLIAPGGMPADAGEQRQERIEHEASGQGRELTAPKRHRAPEEKSIVALRLIERQEDETGRGGADLAVAVARQELAGAGRVNVGKARLHAKLVLGQN